MSAFHIEQLGQSFDIVHMGSILHHLTRPDRRSSMAKVLEMVELALSIASRGGLVVIDEVRYESYLQTELTARLISPGLKMLNGLRIDVSRFMPEIQPGLEVSFFSERQLVQISRTFVGTNFATTKRTIGTSQPFTGCFS